MRSLQLQPWLGRAAKSKRVYGLRHVLRRSMADSPNRRSARRHTGPHSQTPDSDHEKYIRLPALTKRDDHHPPCRSQAHDDDRTKERPHDCLSRGPASDRPFIGTLSATLDVARALVPRRCKHRLAGTPESRFAHPYRAGPTLRPACTSLKTDASPTPVSRRSRLGARRVGWRRLSLT